MNRGFHHQLRLWLGPRILRLSCSVFLGVGMAWLTAITFRPFLFLGDNKVVAFVSEQCPIAQEVVQSASLIEEVRSHVVTISTDDPDAAEVSEFQNAACRVAAEHVRTEAPWFELVSDAWICRQLTFSAMQLSDDEHFVSTPTYLYNGRVLSGEDFDAFLTSKGLIRRRGQLFPKEASEESIANSSTQDILGTVRGSGLGL
jgi:hypothetical protein